MVASGYCCRRGAGAMVGTRRLRLIYGPLEQAGGAAFPAVGGRARGAAVA
jgi:hypothetical protein